MSTDIDNSKIMMLEVQNQLINEMNTKVGQTITYKELFKVAGAEQLNDGFAETRLLMEKLENMGFVKGENGNPAFASESITVLKEIHL